MTEIKIEKKKPIWPWVLLLLIIAAVLVYFFVLRDNDKNTEEDYITNTNDSDLIGVNENNATVAAYVNFVNNTNEEMNLDHDYTNDALLKLVAATKAIANEVDYEVSADLDKVNEYASVITKEDYETTHADYIRNSSDIITNELHNIQQAHYPSLADEAQELKSASESIQPGVLTLDQKNAVKNYFATVADILQKMN